MAYQLAQINIGRLVAPIDDPKIAEFVAQLDPINALADQAPGFVAGSCPATVMEAIEHSTAKWRKKRFAIESILTDRFNSRTSFHC